MGCVMKITAPLYSVHIVFSIWIKE